MDENKNFHPEPIPAMPPRRMIPMGRGELAFGAAVLLCALLLCNSLFFAGINLGFALGAAGTVLAAFIYLLRRGHRPGRYASCLIGLSLAIIGALPRSDDGGLKFLALLALLFVPGLGFCLMSGQNRRSPNGVSSVLDGFRALFALGFGAMGDAGRGMKEACASTGAIGRRGSSVALGLLIALPLLAVLIPLLMSADAAFEGLLDLLPEPDWQELLVTAVTGVSLGFVLYTRAAALHHLPKKAPASRARKGLNGITVNTVLLCAAGVYTASLASQLAYFVGGFSGLLPEEYTLAQYARRGFFEMAWLAAINLTVIALSVGLVSAKERVSLLTKLLCLFLGLVTLFLISTASAKMLLYIGSYGLTRLRVLTQAFMLWLALSTVFVCLWLFRPKTAYMKPILLSALVLCAALLWADVDAGIARYNVRAYQSGRLETVDVSHLGWLSDGAVPYLYELTEDPDPEVAEQARDILTRKARYQLSDELDLRNWNYSSACIREILEQFAVKESAEAIPQ